MHPVGSNGGIEIGRIKTDSPQLDSTAAVTEFKSHRHFRWLYGCQKIRSFSGASKIKEGSASCWDHQRYQPGRIGASSRGRFISSKRNCSPRLKQPGNMKHDEQRNKKGRNQYKRELCHRSCRRFAP
jgi:hypothetical protein